MTYFYKGQQVFIGYLSENKGVQPLCDDGNKGIYPFNGEGEYVTLPAEDDSWCTNEDDFQSKVDGEADIVCEQIVNPENEQSLLTSIVTQEYYSADLYERMLCKRTTSFHEWTSHLTEIVEKLDEESEKYVDPDNESDCKLRKARLEEIKKDWDDRQKDVLNQIGGAVPEYTIGHAPTWEELIEEYDFDC